MKLQTAIAFCLQLATISYTQSFIYRGTDFGIYYYDIQEPSLNGIDFTAQNSGNVTCSNSALSLDQI
jgi:hypothetical protein